MDLYSHKRVRIIFIALIVVMLVIISFAIYTQSRNPYGKELQIANLSDYTKGKQSNKDRLDLIKHKLHTTVSYNTSKDVANNSIDDILVRDKSFSQELNEKTDVYTVTFIVDIASMKQSYKIDYQWSTGDINNQNIDEYGTQITCLPIDILQYKDFKCQDERIKERGVENYDPIGLIIPYHVESKYKVVNYTKLSDNTVVVEVEAYAPRWVSRIGEDLLDEYSVEVNKWIESRKLDPKRYVIKYIY